MKRLVPSALLVWMVLVAAARAWAGAGDLDPTFGNGGIIIQGDLGMSELASLARQADAKLVGVGSSGAGLTLVRYNTDGSLDATFGSGGLVATSQIGGGTRLVLQPDGKLVVGGTFTVPPANVYVRFALARYNTDGSLDATFGTGGIATAPSSSYDSDHLAALALQPDGKVIAAGWSDSLQQPPGQPSFYKELITLARFNADGTPDQTFGTSGWVTKQLATWDYGASVAVQFDGKIIVGGQSCAGNDLTYCRWVILRYQTDGLTDVGFGNRGVAEATSGPLGGGLDEMVLGADGRVAAAGEALGDDLGCALMRFNTDGSIDTSFGNGGMARAGRPFGAQTLVEEADGSLMVGGHTFPAVFDGTADFALMRFTATGAVDEQFGSNGVASRHLSRYDMVNALVVQPDNKIVAGGVSTRPEGGFVWTLARYEDEAVPDSDGDGVQDAIDNCPLVANTDQADTDADGVGDACDTCPNAFNPFQTDVCGSGRGTPLVSGMQFELTHVHLTAARNATIRVTGVLDATAFGGGFGSVVQNRGPTSATATSVPLRHGEVFAINVSGAGLAAPGQIMWFPQCVALTRCVGSQGEKVRFSRQGTSNRFTVTLIAQRKTFKPPLTSAGVTVTVSLGGIDTPGQLSSCRGSGTGKTINCK